MFNIKSDIAAGAVAVDKYLGEIGRGFGAEERDGKRVHIDDLFFEEKINEHDNEEDGHGSLVSDMCDRIKKFCQSRCSMGEKELGESGIKLYCRIRIDDRIGNAEERGGKDDEDGQKQCKRQSEKFFSLKSVFDECFEAGIHIKIVPRTYAFGEKTFWLRYV